MPFPFHADSDVEVLNSWSGDDTFLVARRGTLASGARRKARYSLEVRSQPLLLQLDEFNLGQKPAQALADLIRDQINGISAVASKSTQAMRVRAGLAFQRGESWAVKRYSGGRMGPMAPNQSNKLFQDSGRLAAGIFVRMNIKDSTFSVNVPANRLNPDQFGRDHAGMVQRLVNLVPALDPKKALGMPTIEKAIKEGMAEMMQKAEDNSAATIARGKAKLRAAKMKVIAQIARLAAQSVGL